MNHLASVPSFEYILKVLSGPDKDTVFKLVSSQVTLGRSSDNDISLESDKSCSRQHAVIELTAHGARIINKSERKKITVNGEQGDEFILLDKSIIQLGETKFQFLLSATPASLQVHSHQDHAMTSQKQTTSPKPQKRKGGQNKNSPVIRLVIYSTIGLLLWLALSEVAEKKQPLELRTEAQVEAEMKRLEELQQAELQERQRDGRTTTQYKAAQSHFVEGFRDYKQGQYERAIVSFQACLSLFPSHAACQRYSRLAQKKHDELVQYHMVLGRKYLSQSQYSACEFAFRNVMVMIKDTNNKTFKEASANRQLCADQMKGRF